MQKIEMQKTHIAQQRPSTPPMPHRLTFCFVLQQLIAPFVFVDIDLAMFETDQGSTILFIELPVIHKMKDLKQIWLHTIKSVRHLTLSQKLNLLCLKSRLGNSQLFSHLSYQKMRLLKVKYKFKSVRANQHLVRFTHTRD